jgi:hypothetical protein
MADPLGSFFAAIDNDAPLPTPAAARIVRFSERDDRTITVADVEERHIKKHVDLLVADYG